MTQSATSLGQSGLSDWLLQRFSAIILFIYFVLLVSIILLEITLRQQINYIFWSALFRSTAMQVVTVIAAVAFFVHAWIGLWTIATDYIKNKSLRLAFHAFYILAITAMVFTIIATFWG